MKNLLGALVIGLLMVTVTGCTKKSPQDKMYHHMEELAKAMTKGEGNCLNTAVEVTKWATLNKSDYNRDRAEVKALPEAQQEEFKARIKPLMPTILGATMKCGKDPAFKAAMKKIKL